jgi:hypothetical protein
MGNMLPVNSGFHKLKNFSEDYPHFEYQFQGAKLVAFPGRPRVSGACILVDPAALLWLTLWLPQVILNSLCWIFSLCHDSTQLSGRVSGLSDVLCFVAGRVDTDVWKIVLHSSSGSHSPRKVLLEPDTEGSTVLRNVQRHGVIIYRKILYLQYAVTDALSSGLIYTPETQRTCVWCTCTQVTRPDMMDTLTAANHTWS